MMALVRFLSVYSDYPNGPEESKQNPSENEKREEIVDCVHAAIWV